MDNSKGDLSTIEPQHLLHISGDKRGSRERERERERMSTYRKMVSYCATIDKTIDSIVMSSCFIMGDNHDHGDIDDDGTH